LDNEILIQQFEAIESRVERLIAVCEALEAANSELKASMAALEEELRLKVAAESAHREEKRLIRNRIDSILNRLDFMAEKATGT
jgi:hypothetical protein